MLQDGNPAASIGANGQPPKPAIDWRAKAERLVRNPSILPEDTSADVLRATGTDSRLSPVCTGLAHTNARAEDIVADDGETLVEVGNDGSRNMLILQEVAAACEETEGENKKAGDRIRTGDVQLGKLAFYR